MATEDAYTLLASRHGFGSSQRYRRILEFLMTPRQAQVADSLPMPLEELAPRVSMTVDALAQELDLMYQKGIVFPRNFETREHYRFARSLTQFHDASQSLAGPANVYTDAERRELFVLWEDFVRNEWEPARMPLIQRQEAPLHRIIPAYQAVKNNPDLLPHENMREIFRAQRRIGMVSCSCRARKGEVATPCGRSHDMNCIQFNRAADYCLSRGHGRELSLDDALALLDETEENGLIHPWPNSVQMSTNTLCNCCADCCMNLLPITEYGVDPKRYYAASRFRPEVDVAACSGCQDCVERCQFDAITMERVPGSKKLKAAVDEDKCMGCGVCVLVCAPEAMLMRTVHPPEYIPQEVPALPAGGGGHLAGH